MSVNKVILLGNLGRDPEVRYLDNNKVVAHLSLATSETFTGRNGERKVETEWHNVELWDNLAKVAEKFLKTGSQVYIEGKIKTESWRDKDGNEHTGKKIRALSMTLLGSKSEAGHGQESQHEENSTSEAAKQSNPLTDELPF
jgi:single-strand DNA-binding protein